MILASLAPADDQKPAPSKNEKAKIQLAILLDTSGSMNGLINQARTQIWKIVNELATAQQNGKDPELFVALYEYGKNSVPKQQGYIRQIVPLTDDLDKISEELFALTTDGGNEFCGQVIDHATENLKWSPGEDDLKLIFIAGNEPFTQGSVKYQDACAKAIKKGILVNTIYCGPEAEGIRTRWQDGAQLADGSFLHIDQNKKVAVVKTPFDVDLVKLGGKLNKTYLSYGQENSRKIFKLRQLREDTNAKSASPGAAAQRAAFKGGKLYKNSAWDLVDALKQKKIKLKDIPEKELPQEMKKMTLEERKAYLKKKETEREKIKKEVQELTTKRNQYIAKKRRDEAAKNGAKEDSFDDAVIKTIRKQAEKKNFKFKK